MSTGYDEHDGVESALCVGPPDLDLDFIPSTFLGMQPWLESFPSLVVGVQDVAIELWVLHRAKNAAGFDQKNLLGLFTDGAVEQEPMIELYMSPTADNYRAVYDNNVNPQASTFFVPPTWTDIWHYLVINVDRSGNMTLYVDESSNAVALPDSGAPQNMGTLRLHVNEMDDSFLPGIPEDRNFTKVIGPLAIHIGAGALLTAQEMEDAYREQRVTQKSTTQLRYNWRSIRGETGWEARQTHILPGSYLAAGFTEAGILSRYVGRGAAPEGTAVVIPDLSGNGNDWSPPTFAEYSDDTVAEMARVAFGMDPFWR